MESNHVNGTGDDMKSYSSNVRHKEKRRTENINKAFSDLRKCIPNVPCDTKLSKIKTLHLASSYIAYLSDILENDLPGEQAGGKEFNINFKAHVASRTRKARTNFAAKAKDSKISNNSNRDVSERSSETAGEQRSKRGKGRTGWPETVWAEALENRSKRNDGRPLQFGNHNAGAIANQTPSLRSNSNPIYQYHMNMPSFRVRTASYYSEFEVVLNRQDGYPVNQQSEAPQPVLFANEADYNYTDNLLDNPDENITNIPRFCPYIPDSNGAITTEAVTANPMYGHDLVHAASAVPFPVVPFNPPMVHPLPSISTLCYSEKSRQSYETLQALLPANGCPTSDTINDYEQNIIQNGRDDEPNLAELQPVTLRGSSKFPNFHLIGDEHVDVIHESGFNNN